MEPNESTVWGTGEKTSCLWASLANSVASSCLDADDGHRGALGHPGAVIIPPAIAMGEKAGATGALLLEAIIIGYEVGLRAGVVMNRNQERLFYGSGTWAAFGAAAATSKILGLSAEQCANALGIVEIHTPLALIMGWIRLRKPPEVKEGMGWASLTGLTAALLANKGMIGTFSLQEQEGGESLAHGSGERYEIPKLYFKKYPACRWTHPVIDALLKAKKEHALQPEHVARIHIRTFSNACHLHNPRPCTIEQAQYSIPFLAGSIMVYGRVGPSEMDEKRLHDPLILAVADRVVLEIDPHLNTCYPAQTMARVEITTTSGEKIEITPQDRTRGDFQNPFTQEEMEDKFRLFAGHRLAEPAVEKLLETALAVETLGDARDLTRLLVS
jgi:2-methylcitrate dehydratase PrpD